jgi:hypothetical protein
MARPVTVDNRFDLRGGVNTQMTDDLLDTTEIRRSLNARQYVLGGYQKRKGTKRLHTAAIGAGGLVTGVSLWRPSARQLVALANGDLYYKTLAAANFTEVAGSTLSAANFARFAPWRDGASIVLLFADGKLNAWTGSVLEEDIADAPDAIDVAIYKGRVFAIDGTKRLFVSALRNYEGWAELDGGLFQDIETYDAEGLVAIAKAGSSLLMAKGNSIARYSGVSTDEIRIETETEGVSPIVGCVARRTFIELDGVNFTVADTGPYFVTEGGVEEIGLKVADQFDFANKELWANAVAVYHRGRKEVQLSLPAAGDTGNEETWYLNLRTMGWDGPQRYLFPVSSAARLERADGSESVVVGGDDGFVRDVDDTGAVHDDDMTSAGADGEPIEMALEYPPLIGGSPGQVKAMRKRQVVRADLGASGVLQYEWASEMGSGEVTMASKGAGVKAYPCKLEAKGTAIVRTLREATSNPCEIVGVQAALTYGRRLQR